MDQSERKRDKTIEFWKRDEVPEPKFGREVPVYMLTTKHTFRSAERYEYN